MATLIGAMATLPTAPEFKFWNSFRPKVLSAVTIAGSTGVLACCACTTAGGAEVPGLFGELGGLGFMLLQPPEEPPQPATAPANPKATPKPKWRGGVPGRIASPCSCQSSGAA